MLLTQFRDLVELCALIALALLPLSFDPTLTLQPMQSRIKRAGLHLKNVAGVHSNHLADSIAMLFAPLKALEDQHVQRSLQEFDPVLVFALCHHRL